MSGFSFFTENEESDAGCAWVQDDGFYYIPDLEGEDSESVRMVESNAAYRWQYIGSDGVITDELWNFNSIGAGSKLLGFSENRKYIYFLMRCLIKCAQVLYVIYKQNI